MDLHKYWSFFRYFLIWTEPRLVCEVEFTEWTEEGLLRQPVFLRFRDDKKPEECVRSGAVSGAAGQPGGGADLADLEPRVTLSPSATLRAGSAKGARPQ